MGERLVPIPFFMEGKLWNQLIWNRWACFVQSGCKVSLKVEKKKGMALLDSGRDVVSKPNSVKFPFNSQSYWFSLLQSTFISNRTLIIYSLVLTSLIFSNLTNYLMRSISACTFSVEWIMVGLHINCGPAARVWESNNAAFSCRSFISLVFRQVDRQQHPSWGKKHVQFFTPALALLEDKNKPSTSSAFVILLF